MLKIEKSKTAKLLALSFMLNFTVVQPICSTITYAATRDSDYHTIENSTSKKIQSSRDYLYTPYKSDAERQAEAGAIRQQQAEAEAQRRAAQEALQQSGPSSSSPSGSTYNSDGTVKELGDEDPNTQQAKERLQQMMQNNPRRSDGFNNSEEKKSDSVSTRVANQLSDKDKEILVNVSNSDTSEEKYRVMAAEVCKASGLSDKECLEKQLTIQNCLWGELSHVEASGQEYENAKNTAMQTCVYVLQSEEKDEPEGFLAGIKNFYDGINKKYQDSMPEALKLVLGDSLAEVGVTAGLTLLSFASFGISVPALVSLRAAKTGVKLASKADKVAGMMGKTTNLTKKFESTLSSNTRSAMNVSREYAGESKDVIKAMEKQRMEGYDAAEAAAYRKAEREYAEETWGKGTVEAEEYLSASNEIMRDAAKETAKEASIKFGVLERNASNAGKLVAADIVGGKVVNAAGAGEYVDSKIQDSAYNTQEVNKALQNEEFAKLLESKRSNADITKIAKSVSSSAKNASTSLQISNQVENNLTGMSPKEQVNSGANMVAIKAKDKANYASEVSQQLIGAEGKPGYVENHAKKISDGLKELGVTPEEIKQYQN